MMPLPPHAVAAMPLPSLRLVLPLREGGMALDFGDDERRVLDEASMAMLGLDRTTLYADAETVTPEGWRSASGERISSARLYAASSPDPKLHDRRSGVYIAHSRDLGGPGKPPRSMDVVLYPLARDLALRIDDVYGTGMAADGYTTESRLDGLTPGAPATALLREAGAEWLVESAQSSDDEGERMRAVLRAAWRAGVEGLGREPVEPPPVPEAVVRLDPVATGEVARESTADAPTTPAQGWWAPPDGPALWFETSTLNFDELSVDIATIAKQMQANREQDGVPGAEHILLLPFASNYKLRMIWFDPETGDALGADEYTLVLRVPEEEDDHFDASDFEHLCLHAGQDVVETEGYDGPKLYFRWEWGGPVTALTWP